MLASLIPQVLLNPLYAAAAYLTATDGYRKVGIEETPSLVLNEKVEPVKESDGDSKDKPVVPKVRSTVRIYDRGIYTVWEHQVSWTDSLPGAEVWRNLTQFYGSWPYFGRFVRDVYSEGPWLCVLVIVANLLQHVVPTLGLMQASFLLNVIETAVTTRQVDRKVLVMALVSKVLCGVLEWTIDQILQTQVPILKSRTRYRIKEQLMGVQLRLDLPTCELPDVKAKIQSAEEGEHWDSFDELLGLLGLFVEVALQTGFVFGSLCQQPGGAAIALLSIISPTISCLEGRAWLTVFHAMITNVPYIRLRSLQQFSSSSTVKKEVLGNVMSDHIEKEYTEAKCKLGDRPTRSPWQRQDNWSAPQLLRRLVSESAVAVLALKAITSPETTPLTSIALLQQTSQAMEWTFWRLFNGSGSIIQSFTRLKLLYELNEIENVIKDGSEPYPRIATSAVQGKEKQGMKVEFRDVSFKYPTKEANVIDGLSFTIKPGDTVVIVGENGCGKSSTIKLLTRLYEVTGGEILIDDLPVKDYKLKDLRAASAIMYQDYHHFDLTLYENIGLGNVSRSGDRDAIKEAARLGGADEFIEKLPSGYDTSMNSIADYDYSSGSVPEGTALEAMIKSKKENQKAFSGGETQRLALSRTFMRSTTCDTRLLAYDEPSAALDPKAEFALFERLRQLQGDRTMIFVTHRFGYLTKYADLIIYMDKGKAAEQGSHEDLLALNGQYAHLYNVQAQAFA